MAYTSYGSIDFLESTGLDPATNSADQNAAFIDSLDGHIGGVCCCTSCNADNRDHSGHNHGPKSEGPKAFDVNSWITDFTFDPSTIQSSIPGDITTTTALTVGQSTAEIIDFAGDVDWFSVSLTAGETYQISVSAFAHSGQTGLSDAFVSLYDENGSLITFDDDAGAHLTALPFADALLTFTAGTTGTYFVGAESSSGNANGTGGYAVLVETRDADSIANGPATATAHTIGSTSTGEIDYNADQDWFSVQLEAGQTYEFIVNPRFPNTLGDSFLSLHAADGTLISFDDDGGPDFLGSRIVFTAQESGTYFVSAQGFTGNSTVSSGTYTLRSGLTEPLTPLDGLDWGSALSTVSNGETTIEVYFAGAGESFDGTTSLGWLDYERDAMMRALNEISEFINLTFVETNDSAAAEFKLLTFDFRSDADTENDDVLGFFGPPNTGSGTGVGVFGRTGAGWTEAGLEKGGFGYVTIIHELGHGLGLAHPHDTGGTSTTFQGVSGSSDSGDFGLNQGIFTTMSYVDGWDDAPHGTSNTFSYGWQATMMALDLAVLQEKYGARARNEGDTVYELTNSNTGGTFWEAIWDTGGTDTISNAQGSGNAFIDLREATLEYEIGGGGFISYVTDIFGGFTVANGAEIENAIGGSGDDQIIGNALDNLLQGNGGNDNINGGGGTDTVVFVGNFIDYTIENMGNGTFTITHLNGGADGIDTVVGVEFAQFADQSRALAGTSQFTENDDVYVGTDEDEVLDGLGGNDEIFGAGGNDTIFGGEGDDTLFGEVGNDTLNGGIGNDTINAGIGDDIINGGAGNDLVFGLDGNDLINGGDGNDSLRGSAGNDTINGDAGLDTLFGGDGNDALSGGEDNDNLFGEAGADTLDGDAGDDELNGGSGDDLLRGGLGADTLVGSSGIDTLEGGAGDDTLVGGADDDMLDGGDDNDLLKGGNGADTLLGQDGDDRLNGEAGDDTLSGGGGADFIIAGAGDDTVDGGDGNDTLEGLEGVDTLNGGLGNDAINAGAGDDIVNAGEGDDLVFGLDGDDLIFGGIGADRLRGNIGNDTINGEAGADIIFGGDDDDVLSGGDDNDTLFGDAGDDTLDGDAGDDSLNGGIGDDLLRGGDGNDTLVGFDGIDVLAGGTGDDTLIGGAGNDTLFGAGDNDLLIGGNGVDVLYGQSGDDRLNGGAGNDQLIAGDGADVILAGAGDDSVQGGAGNDTIEGQGGIDTINGGDGDDTINAGADNDIVNGDGGNDLVFGLDGDDLINGGDGDDSLRGNAGNDTVNGDAGIDTLFGGDGDDVLSGGADGDTLNGESGADQLNGDDGTDTLFGGADNDTLSGGDGDDTLFGGSGDDQLTGDAGGDLLFGGRGADTLTGGAGIDVFVFEPGDSLIGAEDLITDLETGELIALATHTFIGSAAFTGSGSFEVRFESNGTSTFVQLDRDGDGTMDELIEASGVYSFTSDGEQLIATLLSPDEPDIG